MTSRLSNPLGNVSRSFCSDVLLCAQKEILLIYREIKYNVGYGGVDILVVDV